MGVLKPSKSKAPAPTQPAGGVSPTKVSDPCCIPGGAGSFEPFVVAQDGHMHSDNAAHAVGHINTPTAH